MAAFLETLEAPGNGWWPAELGCDYVSGIVINGNNANAALMCWSIPSDKTRGREIGRQLLDTAMDQCRTPGFPLAFLTTFRSLDKASAFTSSPGSI
jgi:hypothetical protein